MNKLTIQINNLEALERLIGGDSEVEVEIRNSVVQKFAEKHLKPVANSAAITSTITDIKTAITSTITDIKTAIASEIRQQCEAQIATFKTDYYGRATEIKLRPEIKTEIDRQIKTIMDNTVQKAIQEAVGTWTNESEVKKCVDSRFEYYTKDVINSEIRTRLEKLKTQL